MYNTPDVNDEYIISQAVELSFEGNSCEVSLDEAFLNDETELRLGKWKDTRSRRNVLVHYEHKIYLFHDAFMTFIYSDYKGLISGYRVAFSHKQDVSREIKIKNLLHGYQT